MEQLVLIISLVSKQLFSNSLVTYTLLFLIIIAGTRILISGQIENPLMMANKNTIAFITILFFSQIFALIIAEREMAQSIFLFRFMGVLFFIIVCFCYYFFITQLIRNDRLLKSFTKGFFWGFMVLEIICLMQVCYIYISKDVGPLLRILGEHLEVQDEWTPQLYTGGTFTLTALRVNGFTREPGFLAAMLAICFSPLILAAIKNKFNIFFVSRKYSGAFYYSMITLLISTLLLAKTSTGLIAIMLILISPIFLNKGVNALKWCIFLISITFVGFLVYKFNPTINEMLNHYIFDKGSTVSLPMRLGSFEATWKTIISHPITGVGYNNTSFYNIINFPEQYRNISEYQIHATLNFLSDLSSLGGLIAQFGLIVSGLILTYFLRLIRDIRKYSKILKNKYYCTLSDAAVYFFILLLLVSIFSVELSQPIYFVSIFYFIALRRFLAKKVRLSVGF